MRGARTLIAGQQGGLIELVVFEGSSIERHRIACCLILLDDRICSSACNIDGERCGSVF